MNTTMESRNCLGIAAMKTTYYVLNEHTLGYISSVSPNSFEVLAGKPQRGGHDWKNGSVAIGKSDVLRTATLDDFEHYRVSPVGHIAASCNTVDEPSTEACAARADECSM